MQREVMLRKSERYAVKSVRHKRVPVHASEATCQVKRKIAAGAGRRRGGVEARASAAEVREALYPTHEVHPWQNPANRVLRTVRYKRR